MLTRYDRGLIYFLLFLVLFSLLGTIWVAHSMGKPNQAVVSVNGQTAARFSLQGQSEYKVKGVLGDSKIEIINGRARIVSSPCLQKVCIHKGFIEEPGECVVCAPNQVVVKIVGDSKDNAMDAVSK